MKNKFSLLALIVLFLVISIIMVAQQKAETRLTMEAPDTSNSRKTKIQTTGTIGSPEATTTVSGDQLPAPDPKFGGVIKLKADESTPWWAPRTVPPEGAPNVLLIMTDDQGFGAPGTFGGVIPTPNMDRIANNGLRYTNFHSTSLCSPTRAAIITGRNHHSVGTGVVGEIATGFPGYDNIIPIEKGTVGTILRDNGYSTAWFGKDHNTPSWQSSQAGPFNQWPNGMGFEYFYGFVGGDASQWQPNLFRNTTAIYPFRDNPDWNLETAMADDAIQHIKQLKEIAPGKPWFVYYVPGATHSPHHPTPEWIKRISDMHLFDEGWNSVREKIFANQKRLGIMPENAKLTPWPEGLKEWAALSGEEKKLFIRQMDVYAAYLAYADNEIGRVIQAVDDLGQLDNTLIIYIGGDNGASAEGMVNGTPNEFTTFNGISVPVKDQFLFYPFWGSDKTFPHYAAGWAWAMGTPFKWLKQVPSHYGGTAQGVAVSWPGHIKDVGGIRRQFHHVIDIVPTILEATGIPAPKEINGIEQEPIEGTSMVYTWDKENTNAPTKHTVQYFEMLGNRAIYKDGWVAATTPATLPWELSSKTPPDVITGYNWELYNMNEDPTQFNDLAKEMPDKLKELQAVFYEEAAKYNVLPLDNSTLSRWNSPRPTFRTNKTLYEYTGGISGIPASAAPDILNKSYKITAEVTIPKDGSEGTIVTQGGRFGGYALILSPRFNWWSAEDTFRNISLIALVIGLFLVLRGRKKSWGRFKMFFSYIILTFASVLFLAVIITKVFSVGAGKPVFIYNLLDLKRTVWSGSSLGEGKHTIVFDFKADGHELGVGGTGVLMVDGIEAATKHIDHGIPVTFPEDETFDIGIDTRTGVSLLRYRYDSPFEFTGTINKLTFNLEQNQPDKTIKPISDEDVKRINSMADSTGVEN